MEARGFPATRRSAIEGISSGDAKNLTQEFFARCLEKGGFATQRFGAQRAPQTS